jgi:hypothetical protein
MKTYKKLVVTVLATMALLALAAGGATAGRLHGNGDGGHHGRHANGHGPGRTVDPLTGFPTQINQVDLTGYQIVTSYPLGFDAGNTFQQDYTAGGNFSAVALSGPFVGQPPTTAKYIALPVGHKQILLVWLFADGTHNTFFMNFRTHLVSVVTSGPEGAPSLGTVRITKVGDHRIP